MGINKTKAEMIKQNNCHLSFQIYDRERENTRRNRRGGGEREEQENKKTSFAWAALELLYQTQWAEV